MFDLRKIIIILVVAVLFSVLVFSTIEAIYPRPQYDDYCKDMYPQKYPRNIELCDTYDIPDNVYDDCSERGGRITYTYDANGCAISHTM